MSSIPQTATALPESAKAWENLPVDDKLRFVTGLVQLVGVAEGFILTQPSERNKWRGLVKAGFVVLDNTDDYAIRLTPDGNYIVNTLLSTYLPVEEMEMI